MTERPILFSGEMIRALLSGRKTMTRRVMRVQPKVEAFPFIGADNKQTGEWAIVDHPRVISDHLRCPYGVPGDRLYVRETWRPSVAGGFTVYRADHGREESTKALTAVDREFGSIGFRWRPSIHMPRWASRITLEVTAVRVEPVQDITYEDIAREGLDVLTDEQQTDSAHKRWATVQFTTLWDQINGKRGHAWSLNHFVWVIAFEVVKP